MFKFFVLLISIVFSVLFSLTATAQPNSVYSDLPFWTDTNEIWPQQFWEDDSFGCAGRLSYGDWELIYFLSEADDDSYPVEPEWLKIHNYGVFHCAYGFRWTDQKEGLEEAESVLGHLVVLDAIKTPRGKREIWLFQMGFVPGSEYFIFTHDPEAKNDTLEIVNLECPKENIRDAGAIDIFLTRYCSFENKRNFMRFVEKQAKKSPIGLMKLSK